MSLPRKKPVLVGDRRALIESILAKVFAWRQALGKPALQPRILAALAAVPRDAFVPPRLAQAAYLDEPLDIACGQRISAPSIVAVMTDLLAPQPHHRVLEIGTGCGYQTAVLSRLVAAVYSVELLAELAVQAAARLERLGYANIAVRNGDGAAGWARHAPYDGIILTAAAADLPAALFEQLAPGGRLVAPVGSSDDDRGVGAQPSQWLTLFRKDPLGRITERRVMPVCFVPMIRPGRPAEGWRPAWSAPPGGQVIAIDPKRRAH